MSVDVRTETTIGRPVEVVSAYAADPMNAPRWYDNIESAEWKSEPNVAVGAKVAFTAKFLGRRLAYTYELTDYEPAKRLTMRTAEGPFPMETTYAWEAIDPGTTRMTLRNRGEPRGFSKLAAPFMRLAMRRANKADLAKLRALLEAQR